MTSPGLQKAVFLSFFLSKPAVIGVKVPASFHREETNIIFSKISEIVGLDIGKLSISYPARRSKNEIAWVTIEMNPHMKESLELMYQQLEEHSTIRVTKIKKTCGKKKSEVLFTNFCKFHTITKKGFEFFHDHISILERFMEKRRETG